jgi:hypothetical protein
MKLKRGIALLLAAVFLFGTLAVPAGAAAAQPGPAAQAQTVDAEENDIISVRIKASGELTYGADHKLEIQTTPADAQYIGVVMGTSGQATGYVTLVLSEKIRILLKLIPLPKKMSATPDQTEEFNVYSYLKQLIDGNDVSVLLRVGDEAVSVLNIINFYLPSAYVKTIQNVSNGHCAGAGRCAGCHRRYGPRGLRAAEAPPPQPDPGHFQRSGAGVCHSHPRHAHDGAAAHHEHGHLCQQPQLYHGGCAGTGHQLGCLCVRDHPRRSDGR